VDHYTVKEYTTGEAIKEGDLVTVVGGVLLMADAVTEKPVGIATEAAISGAKCSVQVDGVYNYARTDGSGTTIAPGDMLSPSATDGVMVAHAGTATHVYAAQSLEDSAAATDRTAVKICAAIPA